MEPVKSHITNVLEVAGARAKYDENVKKILSDKCVLAWIMKETVDEYKGMPLESVMECIEGTPEVGKVPVYPGKTPEAIVGMPTDDKVPNEGEITFDIRFFAVTPGNEHIRLHLNIEAQNKYNPGYDLVTRGVFYGARMLSSQLETEFKIPHYDDIKKVYSIWICIDCPKYAQNTITKYHMVQENLFGNFDHETRCDLLTVLMVCLGEGNGSEAVSKLNEMLSVLLSKSLTPAQKENTLTGEFGFRTTLEREELLDNMCNLSESIERESMLRANLEAARNLIKNGVPLEIIKKSLSQLTDEDLTRIQKEIAEETKGA